MEIAQKLKKCHLFSGVTDDNLKLLVSICRIRESQRGELLFAQGEQAAGFFVVASGKVKVYKLSPDGKERVLHIIQPGNTFAEAAIFDDGNYPAFAEPLEKSELLFFPKQEFLDLLHSHSQLSINMIAGLSKFLRQFITQIEDLTFRDVPARLARYLVDLTEGDSSVVHLPCSKTQLASNLGTVSETLSRTFRKLSDEGMIRVQGKNIEILDADRLTDLANTHKET